MEFKLSGMTHGLRGKGGFSSHVDYLGTTADDTPSHSNPKKTEYFKAEADYTKTGSRNDLLIMSRDSVYLQRDRRTFGNIKGRTKADFIRTEKRLMRGTGRNVRSVDFIVSPDPNVDKLDPNNPDDVDRLEEYTEMIVHNAFNGDFKRTDKVTRSGYHKTEFTRTKGDRFYYYAVIQPDSHDSSNLHCHVTVLNYDLTNGNGMASSYYGRNHIKRTVKRTTAEWNALHPDHPMSGLNPSGPDRPRGVTSPTREAKPILEGINAELANACVTSRAKFISGLKSDHHVQARYLRKTKHRKHAAWKFRIGKSSWYSSTRLSRYKGGAELSAKEIKRTLRKHLTNEMNARRAKIQAQAQFQAQTASSAVASASNASAASSTGSVPSAADTFREAQIIADSTKTTAESIHAVASSDIASTEARFSYSIDWVSSTASNAVSEYESSRASLDDVSLDHTASMAITNFERVHYRLSVQRKLWREHERERLDDAIHNTKPLRKWWLEWSYRHITEDRIVGYDKDSHQAIHGNILGTLAWKVVDNLVDPIIKKLRSTSNKVRYLAHDAWKATCRIAQKAMRRCGIASIYWYEDFDGAHSRDYNILNMKQDHPKRMIWINPKGAHKFVNDWRRIDKKFNRIDFSFNPTLASQYRSAVSASHALTSSVSSQKSSLSASMSVSSQSYTDTLNILVSNEYSRIDDIQQSCAIKTPFAKYLGLTVDFDASLGTTLSQQKFDHELKGLHMPKAKYEFGSTYGFSSAVSAGNSLSTDFKLHGFKRNASQHLRSLTHNMNRDGHGPDWD